MQVEMVRDKVTMAITAVCAAGLIGLAAVVLGAVDAQAGEYHVYSCRTPSGSVAPVDGWTGSVPQAVSYDVVKDTCAVAAHW